MHMRMCMCMHNSYRLDAGRFVEAKASTSAAARLPESIAELIVIIASCVASPAKLSLPPHSACRYTARAPGASSAETVE